jgi:PPK2 family polyphosphate:nucleotide phosphotransferase
MSKLSRFVKPYRIERARGFRLKDIDPADSAGISPDRKEEAAALLAEGVKRMAALQDKLYAQDRWSLLLIFQALDAAGKDSVIKHVLSGINPQGCQIFSFKAPSSQERDHDFMWRNMRTLPERGRIGIFNRSYYEEVLVVRVNPQFLAAQQLPERLVTKRIWDERFEDIRHIERYLSRNGVVIRKFFLHVSKKEQKKRFLERLDRPDKNWKFNVEDLQARSQWGKYMKAYEEAIAHTATKEAPWFVVPADRKWFTRLVVSAAIIDALESLDLHYPRVDAKQRQALAKGREILMRD